MDEINANELRPKYESIFNFLDEPLAAQDIENRERIIKLLQKLAVSGTTVVLVAHSSESELTWADKVIKQA